MADYVRGRKVELPGDYLVENITIIMMMMMMMMMMRKNPQEEEEEEEEVSLPIQLKTVADHIEDLLEVENY